MNSIKSQSSGTSSKSMIISPENKSLNELLDYLDYHNYYIEGRDFDLKKAMDLIKSANIRLNSKDNVFIRPFD